ncbi:AcrR family transcriptional regulator [Streptomyces pristinaespiralis]
MTESGSAPGTLRPGGRTARTRAAVRDAVLTGLGEHGYPGLTVEYVAEHSGVHKTTLYRRWGGIEGLLADTLDLAGEDDWSPPDTGSLEGDLRALAREAADSFTDPGQAAAPTAIIAAAFQSRRAADALHAFYAERFSRCERVVHRAVERGEAPRRGPTRGPSSAPSARRCTSDSSSPASRSIRRSPTSRPAPSSRRSGRAPSPRPGRQAGRS